MAFYLLRQISFLGLKILKLGFLLLVMNVYARNPMTIDNAMYYPQEMAALVW